MTVLPRGRLRARDNDNHEPVMHRAAAHGSSAPATTWERAPHVLLMDDEYWAQLPEPLTIHAAALVVRMSDTTVLRRLQDGTIPGHFIGRSWIIFQGEFRAWLASRRNTPLPDGTVQDPLADYDEQLGMSELMEFFGKTKQTIRRWLLDKEIPGYQISGRWTVYKSELRDKLATSSNQRPTS